MSSELQGDSFLIIGWGREGKSAYSYLRRHLPHAKIDIADREPVSMELSGSDTSVHTGPQYLEQAHLYDTIIRSPGVSIRELAPHLGPRTHLTSATNIFFDACPGTIIGVTGTKGKSTTSSLTAAILSQALPDVRLVGNIGKPMLDHLEGASSKTHFVIELSSYQLEDLRKSPHVAILLNIVPEHLDYHGGFEPYCNAKLNIARHQSSSDTLVMSRSFELLNTLTTGCKGRRAIFSHTPDPQALVSVRNREICIQLAEHSETVLPVDRLPVIGPGNLQNALAAVTCAATLGIATPTIREGILSFKPLEHRLEFVAERDGISFYNDSLSTIPEALGHAIQALGSRVETIIAGGFDRGVDMTPVGPMLAASNVKTLILFPTTGQKIWDAACAADPRRSFNRIDAQTMDEAVQAAYDSTAAGKICVLSPAASSFSVFRDYRDRGEQFKSAVQRLHRQQG